MGDAWTWGPLAYVGVVGAFLLGAGLGKARGRATALKDAVRLLRRYSELLLKNGNWPGSGAVREGAALVEQLDDPPRPTGPTREAEA